jgi:hypothetical protein
MKGPFCLFVCLFVLYKYLYLSMYNGPTNELVCNKTLIQMSHIKTLKTLQHVSIIS